MDMALLVLLIVADVLAGWKGTGRNQGTVEQQEVEMRRPLDD